MHSLHFRALRCNFQMGNVEEGFQCLITWFSNPPSGRSCVMNTVSMWRTGGSPAPERMTQLRVWMGRFTATPAPCARPSCEYGYSQCCTECTRKTSVGESDAAGLSRACVGIVFGDWQLREATYWAHLILVFWKVLESPSREAHVLRANSPGVNAI